MLRAVLADDQVLFRQGLSTLLTLSAEVEVVAEVGDGRAAVAATLAHAPDVLLLDVRMPLLDGPTVLKELARQARLPRALLMSTFDDDAAIIDGIRAGALGFVLKGMAFERFMQVLHKVSAGERHYFDAGFDRVLHALTAVGGVDRTPAPSLAFTPREMDVLRLLACGLSNKEIAQATGLAEGTAKNHVSEVLSKLGVRDRTKAVLKALQEGLL